METRPDIFKKDYDITSLTTFGVPARARIFAEYNSVRELTWISRQPEFIENEVLHMGGGSNLLFVHPFGGLVLHSRIMGRKLYRKDASTVFAIAGAGENWADFVMWTVRQGLSGLENLAGIPGEVGAAPVQNVGAYGMEAKDTIHAVEVFDVESRTLRTLKPEECGFGYRDSMFKHAGKGRYVVTRVSFRLSPDSMARNLEYGPLHDLADRLGHTPTPLEVAREVIRVRDAKLPDPKVTGSAGSFFKNPVVGRYYFEQEMCRECHDIPHYDLSDGRVKVPAGWLIEHSGLKGYTAGGAQVYPKQCLVLANRGGATADDVVRLARHVRHEVRSRFGVELHPEVNIIDTSIAVTILGSGTSKGVPEVGCSCRVCKSTDRRDKRLRASALIRTHGLTLLIDPSPDFREQALREDITHIDAVLVTHSHYDHVGGFDDLRPLCGEGDMRVYLSPDVNGDLHRRIDYCFRPNPYPGVPTFDMHEVNGETFFIDGLAVVPIRVMHGKLPIYGFRIGTFAYVTDAKTIPADEMWKLEDLDLLVVNALRDREHFAHFSVSEALALIREVKPKRAILTHFNHEIGLHAERKDLPEGVEMAYDGLKARVD